MNSFTIKSRDQSIRWMAKVALMAAVMCILGPFSIQVGPIPISFTNLVIYFSVYLLGTWKGTLSYLVYMLLGVIGLPVFSGGQGGIPKLFGVTGGYIIGFVFTALISGIFIEKWKNHPLLHLLGMILGTAVCYGFGTVWFVVLTASTFWGALCVCVFPFVVGDFIKMLIAVLLGTKIRERLIRAGLY